MKKQRKLWVVLLATSLVFGLTSLGALMVTKAANNTLDAQDSAEAFSPSSYELKFVLDPEKVLDAEHHLKKEYIDKFGLESKNYSLNEALYLETKDRDFINNDWINRLRQKGGSSTIERTYKKRYPLSGADYNAVQAAVQQAKDDGFDFSSQEALKKTEVDWGYSKMAFSVSLEEDAPPGSYPAKLADFTVKDAIGYAAETMPDSEKNGKNQGWGLETLNKAGIVGPLTYQKYDKGKATTSEGKKIGEKFKIEIWPLPDSATGQVNYITELSFKLKSTDYKTAEKHYKKAKEKKEECAAYLKELGIMLEVDSLKTSAVLDAYPVKYDEPKKLTVQTKNEHD